jgi:hypothetical protein
MSTRTDPPGQPSAAPKMSVARRRLLRGSLGAAPVLMVSAPRSVMAGTGQCSAASSFASANTSRPDVMVSCLGKSPDWWKLANNSSAWPTNYTRVGGNATTFSSVFGAPKGFTDTSFLTVLEFTDTSGPKCLAKHMVAGALNASKTWTPPQIASVPILQTIYGSYRALDYYEPTAGIKWYCDTAVPAGAGGITPWLQSTMV